MVDQIDSRLPTGRQINAGLDRRDIDGRVVRLIGDGLNRYMVDQIDR